MSDEGDLFAHGTLSLFHPEGAGHSPKFHVEYNYNEKPHILFPTAWVYTNDLKYFPRDDEHIPDWLRQKLA